jgi:HlyD family secretion protein
VKKHINLVTVIMFALALASILGKVKPGMAARVMTDSQTQALTGKVSFIASTAEFTPKSVETEELRTSLVYEVRILVDDTADVLRLGQPVTVQLATGGS